MKPNKQQRWAWARTSVGATGCSSVCSGNSTTRSGASMTRFVHSTIGASVSGAPAAGSVHPLTGSLCNTGYEASLPLCCAMSEPSVLRALGKTFFSGACSLQAPGPGTCVDLARRSSSLEEPHTPASGPLRMAEVHPLPFPQLLPHCEDLGRPPLGGRRLMPLYCF